MSKVVCTGPVSSGTRLLSRIVKGWGVDAVHRSMPQWEDFWSWEEWPLDTRFVIIIRRPDYSTAAALRDGHGRMKHVRIGFDDWVTDGQADKEPTPEMLEDWWWKAIDTLASFPPRRTRWMFYAALIANPEVQLEALADWLGVPKGEYEPIRDENAKWRGK